MASLHNDTTGEKVLASHSLSSSYPTNTYFSESQEEIISGLRARIKELESMVSTN